MAKKYLPVKMIRDGKLLNSKVTLYLIYVIQIKLVIELMGTVEHVWLVSKEKEY